MKVPIDNMTFAESGYDRGNRYDAQSSLIILRKQRNTLYGIIVEDRPDC